ncbi:aminotransferase class V-fold PLP-dependent enzyme [Microbacterium sp. NPDC076911]|uniref:aminotransferase class V-fold PLP-dependent enzyme n=1 Tax=Microbacterium sp. NPDC076911 TaxID=3154958 RepID=UPI00341D16B5
MLSVADARREFTGGRGYLAACTSGLPSRGTRAAVIADLNATSSGHIDLGGYCATVENSRALFGSLVGVDATRVAIGSQVSVTTALLAASLPAGAEVLVAEGDFSSIVLPFVHSPNGLIVRAAPLASLADAITDNTALVVFSVVQSATGEVADVNAITTAARACNARTFCDATQAVGWLKVDAKQFDAVVCHAYKWLCSPRGVSFLTVSPKLAAEMPALFAGWYAGGDPWSTCYGGDGDLAVDASRFDVSPAWQAFVGAEPALQLFASIDPVELHDYTTTLAAAFRSRLDLSAPERASAIVTWSDPNGQALSQLNAAGITASGRAGRARLAFHVFNDMTDVENAATALGR